MLFWIFDLDYTLYNLPKNIEFKHSYLTHNAYLGLLLSFLPNKKLIYTNSNLSHCNYSLNKIGIRHYFDNITTKDVNTLKPHETSYITFIKLNNITTNDVCIFFDDSEKNLKTAKLFGWVTILIGTIKNEHYIDFSFHTTQDALEYFINNNFFMG
tara:strand:- start:1536 stop:2000 length:465 start_codon:yes stop_codon:yes gene_type:complete